jgi:hypothetical protein
MNHSLVAIFIAATLLVASGLTGASQAEAQNFAPSAERGAALLANMTLRGDQKKKSKVLMAEARKQAIALRAEIEIAAIDLTSELEKENPSELAAGKLIDKMSKLEGKWRRSRIITWVKIRRLLSVKQRRELRRLQNVNGRNIVKAQGEFINPFLVHDPFSDRDQRSSDLRDPFARRTRTQTAPAAALSRVQISSESPARIVIDGKARGVSPVDLRLRVGRHRVRAVFLDGQKPPMNKFINVVAGKKSYIRFQGSSQAPGAKSP